MSVWHLHHGRWWMVQWQFASWLSFGVHMDFATRIISADHKYGPYIDLHLGFVIISIGRNPVYSGVLQRSVGCSRGGLAPP